MKRLSYIIWILSSAVVIFSGQILAGPTQLEYHEIAGKLLYESQIKMESLVHTGSVNVSTNLELTSRLESEISVHEQQLMFKLTFNDLTLGDYHRDVRVLDHDKRSVGTMEKTQLEEELKGLISYKWVNLVFDRRGKILEKYHSTSFDQIKQIDLTRLADAFLVEFPDQPLRVGDEWQNTYYSVLPPYDQVKPFSSMIRYTYLGKEDLNGIQCDKFKVFLIHQEEGRLGSSEDGVTRLNRAVTEEGGVTRINQIITGTLYFASEGRYLVHSELVNDLTMLVVLGEGEEEAYRNFIRTRLEQEIRLVGKKE